MRGSLVTQGLANRRSLVVTSGLGRSWADTFARVAEFTVRIRQRLVRTLEL